MLRSYILDGIYLCAQCAQEVDWPKCEEAEEYDGPAEECSGCGRDHTERRADLRRESRDRREYLANR